jgi:uncharacterized protein DUF3761
MKFRRLWPLLSIALSLVLASGPTSIASAKSHTTKSKAAAGKSSHAEEKNAKPEGKGYTNVDGKHVKSPTKAAAPPKGSTARCRDGSYSFSAHRSGTCSHHGGVADWLSS